MEGWAARERLNGRPEHAGFRFWMIKADFLRTGTPTSQVGAQRAGVEQA